jgi:hypothetical protein
MGSVFAGGRIWDNGVFLVKDKEETVIYRGD